MTRVTGVPRPSTRGRRGITQISTVTRWRRPVFSGADEVLDQIDALVDAELGILLRSERRYGGRTLALSELTGLTLDPPQAADGKQFERPGDDDDVDGAVDEDDDASSGFATAVLHAADGLAAALAMTIRHAPQKSRGEPQWQAATAGEDWLPPEPADDGESADDGEPAEPVEGQLLALLYRAGLAGPGIDAEYRSWRSGDAMLMSAGDASEQAGASGLRRLAMAAAERAPDRHVRARVAVGAADQYRIDYLDRGNESGPAVVAADGEHRWRVYADRVAVVRPSRCQPASPTCSIRPGCLTGGSPAGSRCGSMTAPGFWSGFTGRAAQLRTRRSG